MSVETISNAAPRPSFADVERLHTDISPQALGQLGMYHLKQLAILNSIGNAFYSPETGRIYDELAHRRDDHNTVRAEVLDRAPLPNGVVKERYPKTTGWVFETRKHGRGKKSYRSVGASLTTEQFEDMQLPQPPEGLQALGIIVNRAVSDADVNIDVQKQGASRIQAMMLVGVNERGLLKRYELSDPLWAGGKEKIHFGWNDIDEVDPGIPTAELKTATANNNFLQIGVDFDRGISSYRYGAVTEMIRPALSDAEREATQSKVKSRFRRYLGSAVLGVLATTSGIYASTPAGKIKSDTELVADVDYRTGARTYDQLPDLQDTKGLEGFTAALADYRNDNAAALQQKVDKSEFGKPHIEQHYFDEIEQASTNTEVIDIANRALSKYNVQVAVQKDRFYYDDILITDPHSPDVKIVTQGILDFMNELGPLVRSDVGHQQILLTDALESNGRNELGSFRIGKDGGDIIRLAAGTIARAAQGEPEATRFSAASVTAHEEGHALNLRRNLIPDFSGLNPEGVLYGQSKVDSEHYLRVGPEVITDYARDYSGDEDEAVTFAAVRKGGMLSFDIINTVVDNKVAATMAGLEKEYPGISAYFMLKALEAERSESRVIGVSKDIEQFAAHNDKRASGLYLAAAFLRGALTAAREKRRRGKFTLQAMN